MLLHDSVHTHTRGLLDFQSRFPWSSRVHTDTRKSQSSRHFLFFLSQLDHSSQQFVPSDPEDCDTMQDMLEERKYPGEVTTPSFKVKFQPKDAKKELLS